MRVIFFAIFDTCRPGRSAPTRLDNLLISFQPEKRFGVAFFSPRARSPTSQNLRMTIGQSGNFLFQYLIP